MADYQITHVLFILFAILSSAAALCYLLIMIYIWRGWKSIVEDNSRGKKSDIFISIIIAARNEKYTLPLLLSDLKMQTYPVSKFEIILIDDHSEEEIAGLQSVQEIGLMNLTIKRLPNEKWGKKEALVEAAKISTGEYLLFTDADCRIDENWIRAYANVMNKIKPGMLFGLVDYIRAKGLLYFFARSDLISLVISGAGMAAKSRPVMCNGANMAVRSDLYLELMHKQLYKATPSGDDVFILHAIKSTQINRIALVRNKDTVVKTSGPDNIFDFLNQRKRWVSKGKLYYDKDTLALSSLVLAVNCMLLISLVSISAWKGMVLYASLYLIKTTADCLILTAGFVYFGKRRDILWLPLFQLIYPFYLLFIVFLSIAFPVFWKGRRYNWTIN